MTGRYHQFGNFVSGVASLSRVVILTMQDISLEPIEGQPGILRMEGTVTTYRYLDDAEDSMLLEEGES
jgi:type IV pilus assembly protein PilO